MKTLTAIDEILDLDAHGLADIAFVCPICGAWHTVPFGRIEIGSGLIETLPDIAGSIIGAKPLKSVVVYDKEIEAFVAENILAKLESKKINYQVLPLGHPGHPLESEDIIGNQAADLLDPNIDIIIGAGSGVISDLTKWISTRLRKPFILCSTAPSMNGYTSVTATITENDIKKSELLAPANAIVADIDVMSKAPISMIRAGMEDLTARAICNADWKLSHLLTGSYFCPFPYQMTAANEQAYLAVAEGIGQADPTAIQVLTEAIMISGMSMTVLGNNTSPSSGGEHILSHFWDLLVHLRGVPKNLHGEQVGVGTIIMLTLYDYVRHYDIGRIDPHKVLQKRLSLEQIEAENRSLYRNQAEAFNQVARQKRIPDGSYIEYIKGIQNRWDKLWTSLDPFIAPIDNIRKPLESAGVVLTLDAIQRTRKEGYEALCNGNRYRPRYTLLDLAWELGILPGDAELILDRAAV